MEKAQATDFLSDLLGKTFRVTTSDTRMFLGQFKCTDADCNIVLAQTYEYRLPVISKLEIRPREKHVVKELSDLTSRYLGLVVIPGQHILRIELEEFISQLPLSRRQEINQSEPHQTVSETTDC